MFVGDFGSSFVIVELLKIIPVVLSFWVVRSFICSSDSSWYEGEVQVKSVGPCGTPKYTVTVFIDDESFDSSVDDTCIISSISGGCDVENLEQSESRDEYAGCKDNP